MVDIEKIKPEIIERLKPLNPDKVILFGSYAYGTANDDSDIDLMLIKDQLSLENTREYTRKARMQVLDLIEKYKIGFDILSASTEYINQKEDYFYRVDILQRGKVLYE